jgi:hypothetical protein
MRLGFSVICQREDEHLRLNVEYMNKPKRVASLYYERRKERGVGNIVLKNNKYRGVDGKTLKISD